MKIMFRNLRWNVSQESKEKMKVEIRLPSQTDSRNLKHKNGRRTTCANGVLRFVSLIAQASIAKCAIRIPAMLPLGTGCNGFRACNFGITQPSGGADLLAIIYAQRVKLCLCIPTCTQHGQKRRLTIRGSVHFSQKIQAAFEYGKQVPLSSPFLVSSPRLAFGRVLADLYD